jgi:hypothetical protein
MTKFYCEILNRQVEVTIPRVPCDEFDCKSMVECGRRVVSGLTTALAGTPSLGTCPAYRKCMQDLGIA